MEWERQLLPATAEIVKHHAARRPPSVTISVAVPRILGRCFAFAARAEFEWRQVNEMLTTVPPHVQRHAMLTVMTAEFDKGSSPPLGGRHAYVEVDDKRATLIGFDPLLSQQVK